MILSIDSDIKYMLNYSNERPLFKLKRDFFFFIISLELF